MSAIAANQTYAARLGWDPAVIVAYHGGFNEGLTNAIAGLQTSLGVEPDGVFGPESYKKWLERAIKILDRSKLIEAGQIAAYATKRRWLDNIVDLPSVNSADYDRCRGVIDSLIRSPLGINWTWEQLYPTHFKWCGTEAADGWRVAGISLDTRTFFFPSTDRLDKWARYLPIQSHKNVARPSTGARMIINLDEHSRVKDAVFPDGTKPRAGDVVLMGPVEAGGEKQPELGVHIGTIELFDPTSGIATTIEGNGTGQFPTGASGRGIVRGKRYVGASNLTTYHIRRIIRPGVHDLVGAP